MAIIANWLNEHIQKKTVDQIVEDTHADTINEDPVLNEYFPIKMYNDRNFLGVVVEKIRPIASVIGFNGKAPTTSAGDFRQVVQTFAKLGLQYVFNEELQFRMWEVRKYAGLQGITVQNATNPDGSVNKAGAGGELADFIFGKAADLTIGLQTVLDNFAWQIIQDGKIEYTDPRTNIKLSVNYTDASTNYDFFPAPGDPAIVNGSAFDSTTRYSWDAYDDADGILDIELDCEAYRKVNGTYPKAIVMSKTAHRHLIRQKTTIEYASTFSTGVTAAKMSNVVLSRVLEDRGLPPIILHDRLYDLEDGNGGFTKVRFLDENKYCFLAANSGSHRAWGPHIEGRNSLYDAPKAGIYTRTYEDPMNSAVDIMEAKATALAICLNPKTLLSRQILWD